MPCEFVLFSKENVFSSSSFYVKFEKYIYTLIHQDASIEETLQFHGWELHIFLLFYLKHNLLWKLTLPLFMTGYAKKFIAFVMTVLAQSSIVGEVVILIFMLSIRGFLKRKKNKVGIDFQASFGKYL